MKRSLLLALLLTFGLVLSACTGGDDDDTTPEVEQNIVEVAQDTDSLSVLVEALIAAELNDDLAAEGPFTVFAPTDEAFTALLGDLGQTKEELLDSDGLEDILLYHVANGEVPSTALTEGQSIQMLNGDTVTITLEGGAAVNGNAISTPDVDASNGVVHIIDGVLLPPADEEEPVEEEPEAGQTIAELVAANEDLTVLGEALEAAGLTSALEADGPFTVFAPTDDAFTALLSVLEYDSLDALIEGLGAETVSNILLYHVLNGEVDAAAVTASAPNIAQTLYPNNFVSYSAGEGVELNSVATVTTPDVDASNGVVHIIDNVLVPAAISQSIGGAGSVIGLSDDAFLTAEGFSLYLANDDTGDTSNCVGGCAANWPPLDGSVAIALEGEDLDAELLSVFTRADPEGVQISYGDNPLYTYSVDAEAGDTQGQGLGERWYLVDTTGEAIIPEASEED